jgi:hypothetical protein
VKTALDDPESGEWWHDLMTRPWTFTIKFESTAGAIEVGQGVEFKSGQVVVEINGRTEIHKDKAAMLGIYTEDKYVIEWHQE